MYKKKVMVILTAATVILSGCGSTAQVEEEVVRPKKSLESGETVSQERTSVQEQVQAPEKLQLDFTASDGYIRVNVDAAVTVPQADGFRQKKVTARAFTQEDYDTVNRVLLADGELWNRIVEETDPAHGFTREEIEERIAHLEEEKAAGNEKMTSEGEFFDYDEAIGKFRAMLESAPEEAQYEKTEARVEYNADASDGVGGGTNYLSGNITVGDGEYFVVLDNNLAPKWQWVYYLAQENGKGNFYPTGEAEDALMYSDEQEAAIRDKAAAAVTEMGFTFLAPAGEEYYTSFSMEEAGERPIQEEMAYGVHFTRMIDGIPVTYTGETGTTIENEEDTVWPYESMYLVYDTQGLCEFRWENPYMVEDMSDEYLFLMPFEEIQTIFRELLSKKYGQFVEAGVEQEFQIDEIRLGYMRVRERETPTEGRMVPVWDFFGSRTVKDAQGNIIDTQDGPFESWFTVNACDGTVIDRGSGY